jgi:dienelactone hydrolase
MKFDAGIRATDRPGTSVMTRVSSPALLGFVLLALVGCDPVIPLDVISGPDAVQIPPIEVPRARMPLEPIPAEYKRPPGSGPFPAVIVLHGCGGVGESQLIWAVRLNRWGYAALIPDSMTPREIKRVCEPDLQGLVTWQDRVGDVGSAVAWLRTRPEIDPNRIAVLGLSHGGGTAVMATERLYAGFGLRAAIDYDGPCLDPAAHGDVPLLVLAGGADDWGHPALRCADYGEGLQPGQVFELQVYPGVYHAFDNPEMTRSVSNGHVMEYNRAAAEDSDARVHAFLDRWDGQSPAMPAPDEAHSAGHILRSRIGTP